MVALDHLVVGAETLAAGADLVERLLGVRPSGGGRHEGAGTHNLLLGLGPETYLEVIARDPDGPEPIQARLFGLDEPDIRRRLTIQPTLLTWVVRVTTLESLVGRVGPERVGFPRRMSRGDLSWRLAVPPAEARFDGLLPGLIEWDGEGAAGRLPDSGCRVAALEAQHPEPAVLGAALHERGLQDAVALLLGPQPRLLARLTRRDGALVELSSG